MRTLEDWRPGQDVRNNARHQQSPEAIRELQAAILQGGPVYGPGLGIEGGLAKITNTGPSAEADLAGAQYWITRQFVQSTVFRAPITTDNDTTDESTEVDGLPGEPATVAATNAGELASGTHLLRVGRYVWYWAIWDRGDPSQKHYIFTAAPLLLARVAISGIIASAGGKYTGVEVLPVVSDLATTGDAELSDFGTEDATTVYIIDENEVGRVNSSHLNSVGTYHTATLIYVNADGKRFYSIKAATGPYVRFEVYITQVGGSNGSATVAPAFTYDVEAGNGEVLATGVFSEWDRPKGAVTAATRGVGFYQADGAFVLAEVNEVPDTADECT